MLLKILFDPRGRPQSGPVVITIFTHVVRTSVRPSGHPSVPKLQNQATITAGRDCGLAEWIIDHSCLVFVVGSKVPHMKRTSFHNGQVNRCTFLKAKDK